MDKPGKFIMGVDENGQLVSFRNMDKFQKLVDLVQSFETDFQKFYENGNKTAGIRVRKNMQELRKYAQMIRDDIQEQNQRK